MIFNIFLVQLQSPSYKKKSNSLLFSAKLIFAIIIIINVPFLVNL